MARGRAPNLSLPPTRALTQQRDYRARKAARIAYLERTNKELGDEVDNLRRELVEVKEGKARDGDVEKLRAVRETLVSALTAIDRILPPTHIVVGNNNNNDTKLSIIVDTHDTSPASGSMYDPGAASDRKGKRKLVVVAGHDEAGAAGEGSSGFESSSGDETSPQTGRSTSQLVEESSRRPSPMDVAAAAAAQANAGESSSSRGAAGGPPPPPKALSTSDRDQTAKRSRKVSGTSSPSAAGASSVSQPTGMAMAPSAAVMYGAPSYPYHLEQPPSRPPLPPPPVNHHMPPFGQFPGQEQSTTTPYPPPQHWDPRAVVSSTGYMMPPPYPSSETTSQISMTPSPHSAERHVAGGGWHDPSPGGYDPRHVQEGGRGGFQPSPAGSTVSSRLPPSQSSPYSYPEHRQGPASHPPRGETTTTYDPSCCNGMFDCSSIPPPLRPVMHDVTMNSGPAAAAAVLSFERSVPPPPPPAPPPPPPPPPPPYPSGNMTTTWSGEHRTMQTQQQHSPQGQPPRHLHPAATTTVQWQEWDRRVSGSWSSATSDGGARLDVPSASSGGVTPGRSAMSVVTPIGSEQGMQTIQQTMTGEGATVGTADDDKCCWGVVDCEPPHTQQMG